jgi:hypothetical protein
VAVSNHEGKEQLHLLVAYLVDGTSRLGPHHRPKRQCRLDVAGLIGNAKHIKKKNNIAQQKELEP